MGREVEIAGRIWQVSVTELIMAVRELFTGMVPTLERCHVQWREEEGDDVWDRIAEAIYLGIVEASLAAALPNDIAAEFHLLRYGFSYNEVGTSSCIVGCGADNDSLVFVAFTTAERLFDSVIYQTLEYGGRLGSWQTLALTDRSEFALRLPEGEEGNLIRTANVLL